MSAERQRIIEELRAELFDVTDTALAISLAKFDSPTAHTDEERFHEILGWNLGVRLAIIKLGGTP